MSLALACLAAYLIGAIPFALLLVKVIKGVDVRELGSGNVGATNASRAFGPRARVPVFALVYVLDFAKGFVPAWLAPGLVGGAAGAAVLAGAAAVLGHCTSPYLGFRGGKGVATTTGVVASLDLLALLAGIAAWLVLRAATGQVFVGSLGLGVALAATVILREPATAFGERLPVTLFALAIAAFFFFTHRSNIRKLMAHKSAGTTAP